MIQLSDVALIYIVLVVLYLVESAPWVRPGCTALSTFLGRVRNPANNKKIIGNDFGYLGTFGWAPFDATIIAESCPISISTAGLVGFSSASAIGGDRPLCTETLCRWEDVKLLRQDQREIWLKDRLLCRLGSVVTATELLGHLQNISAQKAENRADAIASFAAGLFDTNYVQSRIDSWTLATKHVKKWSFILFVWIFFVGGIRYHGLIPGFSDAGTLWAYLAALVIAWWTNNAFQFFAHRKLYPDAKGDRLKTLFTTMVSPAATLRATDHLGRNLVCLKHPLAVAATLCTKPELTELTAAVLRDLRYPKVPESSSDDQDSLLIVSSFRSTIEEAIAKFATNSEITCEPADSGHSRHDTGSLSYCPRCLQEFSVSDAQCTMCGNRSAIPFAIE